MVATLLLANHTLPCSPLLDISWYEISTPFEATFLCRPHDNLTASAYSVFSTSLHSAEKFGIFGIYAARENANLIFSTSPRKAAEMTQ